METGLKRTVEMNSLLENRFAPITIACAFIEAPLDFVCETIVKWHKGHQAGVKAESAEAPLAIALHLLEPLTTLRRRELLVATASSWTACFDNSAQGGDPFGTASHLALLMKCRSLVVQCVPHTLPFEQREAAGTFGAVTFELIAPEQREWLNYERAAAVSNDGGRWVFREEGKPLPFERIERFACQFRVLIMIPLNSKPISVFLPLPCPCCGRKPPASSEPKCCECGYAYPLAYSIPYDFQWSFEEPFLTAFRNHRALHLLGHFIGKNPERLMDFKHIEYLSISRYPKFDFSWLSVFGELLSLELDYLQLKTLDGIEKLPLKILKMTELRQLESISALGLMDLKVIEIALCNRIRDYNAIGDLYHLERFELEAKFLESLDFLRKLSHLRELGLAVDKVEKDSIEVLANLSMLERLGIRKRLLGRNGLVKLKEMLPGCKIDVWETS